jgi:hypothetical protein
MIKRDRLSVNRLRVDPMQSRDDPWTGDDEDRQLAASIDADGLYQDIIVRPLNDVELGVTTDDTTDIIETTEEGTADSSDQIEEYAIIAGSRRYYAALEAGKEEIPCKIITADDLDAAWTSLKENTDRSELSEQEIASQLNLIYELVRPIDGSDGTEADGDMEQVLHDQNRFDTEREAVKYLAEKFLGRSDDGAIELIRGHLRTANLPSLLQSLFKRPEERSQQEQTALRNYDIDTRTIMGSGEGKSGTSREVVSLHDTLQTELGSDEIDPTSAVLEAVGSLRQDSMSEQEFRRSLREFRHEVGVELDDTEADEQRQMFRTTLNKHASELRELHEEVKPERPFTKIDVMGPETQRHSRWHVKAMHDRQISSHSELVSELYTERLEELAEQRGWE